MININMHQDPHSHPANSPVHQDPLHYPSDNFPPTQNNDRQYKDSLHNNPSHTSLTHLFQKKSNPQDAKAYVLGLQTDQEIRKGQDEGRTVAKRLKALAKEQFQMNMRHKSQMKLSQREYKAVGNEAEEDSDESSEGDKRRANPFQKRRKRTGENNREKRKLKGKEIAPVVRRILVDDIARQKDYYGKEYRAKRVVSKSRFALAIARIVIRGKDPKACDVLRVALEKVNPEALKAVRRAIERQKKNRIKRFFPELRKRLKKPFGPNSTFVFYLGIVLFFTILTEALFSTYLVTFVPKGQLSHDNGLLIFCYVADGIFILRVFISFHIAIYDQGELRTSFRYIAIHYFKTMLIIDVFTLFNIIGYFFLDSSWRALIALAAIRIYKVPMIISVFENYFEVSREIGSLIRVMKLGLILYVYAHMCACALYALGSHEDNPPGSWITSEGFEGQSPGDLYVISVYWAAQTITTVGYGDITPVRIQERVLLIAIFLGSSIVLGYIISTIANILAEMRNFTEENWEKIRLLKKYMDDKGLKKETQERVMRYVTYYLGRENISKIKESGMMQFLSENLKEDIIKEVNAKALGDCPVFSYNFGRPFLLAVAKELLEKSYGPDDYIFGYQENDSHSAYFILSGKVELVYGKCNVRVALLEKSNIFGFMAFFAEEPRAFSAKSVDFTTVFELPRELFTQKFKEFPGEKESFCLIKDNIGLYKNNQNLVGVHCFLCGRPSHLIIHCPIAHWYTSPLKVISRYLMGQEKFRRSFKRRDRGRFSAFGARKELQEAAEKIQNSEKSDIVQNVKGLLLLGQEDVESYSSVDEIMDRNIYDPEPLVFTGDLVESKELEVGSRYVRIFGDKEGEKYEKEVFVARPKVELGDIQVFVTRQYDAYLHNLNLDQAKNFQIYFPHNNIGRVLESLETERLKRLAKAHHLPEVIVKNLKFVNDKSKPDPRTLQLSSLNGNNSKVIEKKKSNGLQKKQNTHSDVGQSQMFAIPSKHRSFSGLKSKKDESDVRLRASKTASNVRRKSHEVSDTNGVNMAHSGDQDAKENTPPIPERSLQNDEKGDGEMLPKGNKEGNEEVLPLIEERSEESRTYRRKVLRSDYDRWMRKFTDMLAQSMGNVDEG